MAQSSQFSAAKVLEAAQQAEAGGNREYAVQFYRHITEQHPQSTEAVSAHEGLSRLLGNQPAASGGGGGQVFEHTQPPAGRRQMSPASPVAAASSGPPPAPGAASTQSTIGAASLPAASPHQPGLGNSEAMNGTAFHVTSALAASAQVTAPQGSPAQGGQNNGLDHAKGPGSDGAAQFAGSPHHSAAASPSTAHQDAMSYQPAQSSRKTARDSGQATSPSLHLPVTKDRYRIGRMIAVFIGLIGWLLFVAGIMAVVAVLAGPGLIPGIVPKIGGLNALVPVVTIGVGAFFIGLVMVFSGQLARAVFDNANSARELVAIQRAINRL